MAPLEQETNIDVLRQYSLLATQENARLREALQKLTESQVPAEAQEWLGGDLRDQLSRLQQKFYGFGREKMPGNRKVGHCGEQLKLHGSRVQDERDAEASVEKLSTGKLAGSEPLVIEHEMCEEDFKSENALRSIEDHGVEAWKKMKKFYQESVEITVREVTYQKVIHRQAKYRLKDEYKTSGKEVIITAPGPVKLKPGSKYSVDFALAVVSDKYEYHLPLERQRRRMEAAGLDIDVKTLYGLCESTADHMESVVAGIRLDLMNDFCALHIDESPWLILGEKKRGQMWAMSNRVGSYYRFEPTRSGAIAEEMLRGHAGAVLTDALPAYNRLKDMAGVRRGLCWAHVRREFYERMDQFPIASEMVEMIDELFGVEAKAGSFDDLRLLRKTESREIVHRMQSWILEQTTKHLPGDGIKLAINYAANHWQDLTTFLKDLSLPLSNNDTERALRHVVLGRKNFAGSKTINGADVAATLYTVIESAKKVGLQPKEYMKYVITERWHGRQPKTPMAVSLEKFGRNSKITFPEKTNWMI